MVAVAQGLGIALKAPTQLEANDISRWCTVWSLLGKGTYAIDDCPWQFKTQDKVKKPDRLPTPSEKASALTRFEYQLAPRAWKEGTPTDHFYSSKPPLLPTMIAGMLYPFRATIKVPLDYTYEQKRNPRYVQKERPNEPGKFDPVLETPKEPAKWPAYVLYLKPAIVLINIVPFWIFLVLFARLLDRYAENDWAWFLSLAAAGFGTPLLVFDQTLNNHTVAAFSAFFALYFFLRIWNDGQRGPLPFMATGFFGAFCACNELPAALFGLLLFLTLLFRFPRQTLLYFVPLAAIPCVAFLATQFLAFGQFRPVYEEFGTKSYNYEGSYWNTPLEMDWYNKNPEPDAVYLFHMTFGHHGIFSMSPIVLLAIFGALRALRDRNGLRLGGHVHALAHGRDAGVLSREQAGAQLRWLDPRAALAVLADPVLADLASQRPGTVRQPQVGSRNLVGRDRNLGVFGGLRGTVTLESPVASGSVGTLELDDAAKVAQRWLCRGVSTTTTPTAAAHQIRIALSAS